MVYRPPCLCADNVCHVGNHQMGLVKSPMGEAAIVLSPRTIFSYRAVLVFSMSAVRGRPYTMKVLIVAHVGSWGPSCSGRLRKYAQLPVR